MDKQELLNYRDTVVQDLQYLKLWRKNRKHMLDKAVTPMHRFEVEQDIKRIDIRMDKLEALAHTLSVQLYGEPHDKLTD